MWIYYSLNKKKRRKMAEIKSALDAHLKTKREKWNEIAYLG